MDSDRPTDRPTDRHTDRQTDTVTPIYPLFFEGGILTIIEEDNTIVAEGVIAHYDIILRKASVGLQRPNVKKSLHV